ncbi:MAG TPA: hypothetical protein VJY64_02595 [Candidatus Onthovivens sp.]|nr:hypothetical protein [Candidatus Onthovivens sp.]
MGNKNIKVVKTKKKFNMTRVMYYLKSLINNQSCKEIGVKKWPWSIIVFFVSVLIAMIPTTVSAANMQGSGYISNTRNDVFKNSLHEYANSSDVNDFKITGNVASFDGEVETEEINVGNGIKYTIPKAVYTFEYTDSNSLTTKFKLFFIEGEQHLFSNTATQVQEVNKDVSYIIFGERYYISSLFSSGQQYGSVSGNYSRFEDVTSFKGYLLKDVSSTASLNEQKEAIITNYGLFVNTVYESLKMDLVLVQSGIILGINGGLILLMALVVYFMTRGKYNPNRDIKIYQAMGIAFTATLTPALLAMILGFLVPSFSIMMFIMIYGFRIMWLSMKYLRPQPQA